MEEQQNLTWLGQLQYQAGVVSRQQALDAGFRLCVELDGKAAHPAEGRWRDTRRDNANLAQGVRTLRYGWPDVTEYRCRTAAEVAEVLRGQGWTGTLRRCGPACTAVPAAEAEGGTRSRAPVNRQAGQSGKSGK